MKNDDDKIIDDNLTARNTDDGDDIGRCQKNKMKPTNPNADTYVE